MSSRNYESWGPYAWYKFHKKAIEYPRNPSVYDINNVINYYHNIFLRYIGCKKCVRDYTRILIKYPIRTKTNNELFNWSVNIHNIINAKLGKRQMNYDEARQYWNNIIFSKNASRYGICQITPFWRFYNV